ncbi:MAG: hypothetical protein RH946_05445 [Rhodospirillales bacterium]
MIARLRLVTGLAALLIAALCIAAPVRADDLSTLEPIAPHLTAIAISSDSRYLAAASSRGWLSIWNLETGMPVRSFKAHDDDILLLNFTYRDEALLSGGDDKTAKLWRVPDFTNITTLEAREHVTGGIVTHDGSKALIGLWDGTVDVHDLVNGEQLASFRAHIFGRVMFEMAPDGKTFATAGSDQTIRLWDTKTLKQIRYFENGDFGIKAHKGIPYGLKFLGDDRLLSSASRGISPLNHIVLWDIATGTRLKHLEGVTGQAGVAVSADRTRMAFADHHQHILQAFIYNIPEWRQERVIPLPEIVKMLTMTPNGRLLITGSAGGRVGFRDAATGKLLISAWARFDQAFGAEQPDLSVIEGPAGAAVLARTLAPYLAGMN